MKRVDVVYVLLYDEVEQKGINGVQQTRNMVASWRGSGERRNVAGSSDSRGKRGNGI